MASRRITRFTVGRRRIDRGVSPLEASYTRSIRRQAEQIERNLAGVLRGIKELTPGALRHGLQPIFDESQKLVPVLTGDLKKSGRLHTDVTSRGVVGLIAYAEGGKPFYAVFVHERLDLKHDGETQAKFLEEAVNRKVGQVGPRIKAYFRRETGV